MAPWVMGLWTDAMGADAARREAYYAPFGLIGALMATASVATFAIRRLGATPTSAPIEPISEVRPATLEPVG